MRVELPNRPLNADEIKNINDLVTKTPMTVILYGSDEQLAQIRERALELKAQAQHGDD